MDGGDGITMRIANGIVYADGKLTPGLEVSFEGDTITDIGTQLPADETVDATGCYVVPGFIDVHIHGFAGHDTMEGEDGIRAMARGLPRYGVTSFLPTTITSSVADLRSALAGAARVKADPCEDGATVLGAFMEGPFFNEKRKGAQPAQHLALPSIAAYEEMTADSQGCVRMISLAPELPGALPFIDEMVRRGVTVACGHTDASSDQVMEAVAHGASHITHLFNAMTPLHHREPGVSGAALSCPQLTVELISDLIHIHALALRTAWLAKGTDRCICITDSMMAGGMPDGQYTLGGQDVTVQNGAARLSDGTLAGSTLTMDKSLRNMVNVVGVPLEQALPMYTLNPARRIGETRRGALQPGNYADIVLLTQDLHVKSVWVSGRKVV